MIRPSSYVLASRLRSGDDVILVHGYSGAVDIISQSLYEIISDPERLKQLNSSPTIDIYRRLVSRGYLVTVSELQEQSDFVQIAENIHEQRCQSARNTFWVIPSYRCNLRCFYCFQSHSLHRSTGPKSLVMDSRIINDLFQAMEALGGPFPHGNTRGARYLTLFGGEPLMIDTEHAVREISSRALAQGYKVGAVTNGIELDRYADILGPIGIRWIQITLDGTGLEHDKRRRSINDGENFARVVKNITLALEQSVTVNLRTNVDVTLCSELAELEALATRLGWSSSPYFTWTVVPLEDHVNKAATGGGSVSAPTLNDLMLSKGLACLRPPHRDRAMYQLEALLDGPIYPLIETSACGAHTGMWFFDPFHQIYSCAEQAGRAEFALGTYTDGIPNIDAQRAQKWKARHIGSVTECSRCGYAFFCGGGCANAARLESGNMFAPRCFGIKEVFDQAASEFAMAAMLSTAETDLHELCIGDLRLRSLNSDNLVKARLGPAEYVSDFNNYMFETLKLCVQP
jgi:uncharacterized protein